MGSVSAARVEYPADRSLIEEGEAEMRLFFISALVIFGFLLAALMFAE